MPPRRTQPKNKAIETLQYIGKFLKYVGKHWKEAYIFLALNAALLAVIFKQIDWNTFGIFLASAGGLYATLKSKPS